MDKSFAEVSDRYAAWMETRCPNLAYAESVIDTLIAQSREMAVELAAQDGMLVYQCALLIGLQEQIKQRELRIAALEAQVKRLREGGPLTRSERIVAALQALRQADYSP